MIVVGMSLFERAYRGERHTSMTPGMQVSVVNSYAAVALSVSVMCPSSVDYSPVLLDQTMAMLLADLSDRGEADHSNARIARLEHLEPVALGSRRLPALDQLGAILGQLRLQHAQMVLRGWGGINIDLTHDVQSVRHCAST